MDDMEVDPDLAAQMGFASFGSAARPKGKKRKPDPDSPEQPPRGRGGHRGHRGGRGGDPRRQDGNTRTQQPPSSRLDQSEGFEATDGDPGYVSGTPPPSADAGASGNPEEISLDLSDDDGPVAADAGGSKPSQASQAPSAAQTAQKSDTAGQTGGVKVRSGAGAATAPQRGPNPAASTDGKKPDGSWDLEALKRGIRNANGDMVYFQTSFIEDPWADLLKQEKR